MSLTKQHCPECNAEDFKRHTTYSVKSGEQRLIFCCQECGTYFSETNNTPLAGLKIPVSRISMGVEAVNDGLGLNAACRITPGRDTTIVNIFCGGGWLSIKSVFL